jgi:hypothetical protein
MRPGGQIFTTDVCVPISRRANFKPVSSRGH